MAEASPHMIVRGYDESLVNTASACLLYMLSESSLAQLLSDKETCESYKREPTKTNHDAVMKSVRNLKTPLHRDNLIDFSHGIFVVLEHIFEGGWQGIKFSNPEIATNAEAKDKNFRAWAKSVARIIEDMAGGIHGRGKEGSEEVIKKWDEIKQGKEEGGVTEL